MNQDVLSDMADDLQDPYETPRAVQRARKVQVTLADVLSDMADELRSAPATDAAGVLRALALTSEQARGLLAALDGVDVRPRVRQGDDETVESAAGQGAYSGPTGTVSQVAENHGQRVIAEALAVARAYMDKTTRPKLAELMDARIACVRAGDIEGADELSEKMLTWYGIDTRPMASTFFRSTRLQIGRAHV